MAKRVLITDDVIDGETGSIGEVHYAFHWVVTSAWLCIWLEGRECSREDGYVEGFDLACGELNVVHGLSETLRDWNATDVSVTLQPSIRKAISTPPELWRRSIVPEATLPPPFPTHCLCFLLSFEDQHIVEEIAELYVRRIETLGHSQARRWYWVQSCGLLVRKLPMRIIRAVLGLKVIEWTRLWR